MKKSRLLEIIREEITGALNEAGLFTLKNPMDSKKGLPQTLDPDDATEKSSDFLRKYKKVMEIGLEEDQLNETPIYSVEDMEGFKSTLDKFREEGVSKSKSLNLLLKKLEDEGTVDTNALSKEYGVDTATFNNKEIRKFLNRPEDEFFQDKTGEELIDFTPYLEKADKPRGRAAGEKTEPKEKTALPDSGIKKPEAKKSEEAPVEKEPKAAEKKPEAKKEEPKKPETKKPSAEEKAEEKAKQGSSKLDKMSDDKDQLLKALDKAEKERLAVAEKRKNAKSEAEREKLLDDLKRINKLEGELRNRIAKLGY